MEVNLRAYAPEYPLGITARADIIATITVSGKYYINEIKTGNARYSKNQIFVYNSRFVMPYGEKL